MSSAPEEPRLKDKIANIYAAGMIEISCQRIRSRKFPVAGYIVRHRYKLRYDEHAGSADVTWDLGDYAVVDIR